MYESVMFWFCFKRLHINWLEKNASRYTFWEVCGVQWKLYDKLMKILTNNIEQLEKDSNVHTTPR